MITDIHGADGLPEDRIYVNTVGHAGQSLGAYIPQGLTIHHTGDANDYVGKGLSGGKVIVKAPTQQRESEIIIGNVCFYGASYGKALLMVKLVNDSVLEIVVYKLLLKVLVIMVLNI